MLLGSAVVVAQAFFISLYPWQVLGYPPLVTSLALPSALTVMVVTDGPGIALDAAVGRRHDRTMHVEAINIGPSEAIAPVQAASALAGKGLQGDRHFYQEGAAAPGQALTLIEAEVLESVGLTGAESRRQVVVRGVQLNDLVGKSSSMGSPERPRLVCSKLETSTQGGR